MHGWRDYSVRTRKEEARRTNLCRGMHLKVTVSTTAVIPRPQQSARNSSALLSHDHVTILPLASAT